MEAMQAAVNSAGMSGMTLELWMLTWSVALAFVQIMIPTNPAMMNMGMTWAAGNRDVPAELTGWAARSKRAAANMMESLPLFAALVLTAHVAGKAGDLTALGAQLFFWARLAYAIIYIIGIPWLRTLVWFVAVIGMLLIFIALF